MPEGSGTLSRGRSHRRCWTATVKKLNENIPSTVIFSFWRGDKPPWLSASDQEATCPVPASRNSRGPPTTWGGGQGNGVTSCWWRKSVWKMRGFWNTLYSSKSAISNWPELLIFAKSFLFSHATSCAPCAKAKTACNPFDAERARAKAKAEVARRSKARKTKQQTDTEWKTEVLRKLDGLSKLQGLRKDMRRIAVALERLAGIESLDSDEELLS